MKSRSIELQPAIDEIINKCTVCHLAMVDPDNHPYVLPFNFGYQDGFIYLHSAPEGKKIDILNKNAHVCVAFSTDYLLRYQNEAVACSWSMKYRSVLAYGNVEFITDLEEKATVLNIIMMKYAGKEFTFNKPALENVKIYRIAVSRFEGRAYGY